MNNPMKFEHPERLKELDIVNTLKKASISSEDVVCDYGAGTGIFTIQAAKMTKNKVLALDMNSQMLQIISKKVAEAGLGNVETKEVKPDSINCDDNSVDLFLLVTVLHEIKEVPKFIEEVKRVLKSDGRVMLIDFHKKETPMGPPVSERMSQYQAARHFLREDIVLDYQCELGNNLYMLLLKNQVPVT